MLSSQLFLVQGVMIDYPHSVVSMMGGYLLSVSFFYRMSLVCPFHRTRELNS